MCLRLALRRFFFRVVFAFGLRTLLRPVVHVIEGDEENVLSFRGSRCIQRFCLIDKPRRPNLGSFLVAFPRFGEKLVGEVFKTLGDVRVLRGDISSQIMVHRRLNHLVEIRQSGKHFLHDFSMDIG